MFLEKVRSVDKESRVSLSFFPMDAILKNFIDVDNQEFREDKEIVEENQLARTALFKITGRKTEDSPTQP